MTTLADRLLGPWVRGLDAATLQADGLAGLLGALLVLPQGFAFARLAGLPPEVGLMTAVVPCIVAALFGSSRHVVSGPTNANSLALYAALAPLAVVGSAGYVELAFAVTVAVGAMQWLIGALRLGAIANFISPAALRGFLTGAAALIVVHSLGDLLGLAAPAAHGTVALLAQVAGSLGSAQPAALAVGAATLGTVVALRRARPGWPAMLIGLVVGTGTAAALAAAGAGDGLALVGPVPPVVPHLHVPRFDLAQLPDLVSIAFALTIVALGQSISIAKAVAARSGQPIDANREFRGQGLANLVGGFGASYVACGSLNRSMPNYEAGARTPLAAVFASLWLLALVAGTGPLLAKIPMAAIAGLLLLIGASLLDIAGWRRLRRESRPDFGIALATAVATVTIRIEMAIVLGTILSLVTYLYRTAHPFVRVMGFDGTGPERAFVVRADAAAPLPECPQLRMVRMEGEVYFGAVPYVADLLGGLRETPGDAASGGLTAASPGSATSPTAAASPGPKPPAHLLVMAKSMNFIDLSAADLWRTEMRTRRALGGDLYFHRPRPPVLQLWERIGYLDELGRDHVFGTKRIAIAAIFERLDRAVCARCRVRLYEECRTLPPPVDGPAPPDAADGR